MHADPRVCVPETYVNTFHHILGRDSGRTYRSCIIQQKDTTQTGTSNRLREASRHRKIAKHRPTFTVVSQSSFSL